VRILVVGEFAAGSQKAHAINTIKMAQGFKRLGHTVAVVCFQAIATELSTDELAEIYGLNVALTWMQIPQKIFGLPISRHWGFAIAALSPIRQWQPDLIYARGYTTPFLTSLFGLQTVAEKHTAVNHNSWPFRFLIRATHHSSFALWVTISHRLVDYYAQQGAVKDKLIVLPDAVDLELFERPESLTIPSPFKTGKINVVYAGHLYDYKGIPTILEAASKLPEADFHLVGGLKEDVRRQQDQAQQLGLSNVFFHGLKPQTEIPAFLWHADYLLLPPSQHHPSAAWTSPIKLAEYLASGTPVIASNIESLRDWVTDNEVAFFEPDNAQSLVAALWDLAANPDRKYELRHHALEKAQTLTYENRASIILSKGLSSSFN